MQVFTFVNVFVVVEKFMKCLECGCDYSGDFLSSVDLSDIWSDLSFEYRFAVLSVLQHCCENCFLSFLDNLKKGLKNG